MSEWIDIKDKIPKRGDKFLMYFANQPNLMMVGWVDVHDNYLRTGGEHVGTLSYPNFTHWMLLPDPPRTGGTR